MKKILFSVVCLSASLSVFAQFDEVQTSTTTTSSTTTTTTTDDFGGGVNMNVNMGGMGGINVNVNPIDGTAQQTTTVRTTTTRTGTSGTSGTYSPPPPPARPAYNGYTGRVGCPMPMTEGEFGSALGSVSQASFESTKLSTAKQVLSNRCVTAQQVRGIMKSFEFESTRLEFAKFAWSHTYDLDNYYQINDAFEFDSSVSELQKFVH
ncbi:MAG: hypothetical protein RI894_731 [Bacteroidota bacterium]|jgi:hypothetical protein